MRDYTDGFDVPDYRIDLMEHHAEIEQEATTRVGKRYAERMEQELRGAWRAGYDYLHVYRETPLSSVPLAHDPIEESYSMTMRVLPSNNDHPLDLSEHELQYAYTYDLTAVPDHVIRAAIRGELDGYERLSPDR